MNASNKIQIRAQVLQSVLKFKSTKIPSDREVESCIKALSEIEDKEFVINLLLKEVSGVNSIYDNVLVLIMFNLSDTQTLSECIFKLLCDCNVPDAKKLFLINLLREQGQNVDYNFIQSHISNPDEVIDAETKKFLDEARVSPETQIDFFDFYFAVSPDDRNMLINSIVDDYKGESLANILAPFAYFYPEVYINEDIIQALFESKSYFALPALKWCANNCPDKKLAKSADKAYKKMILGGFDSEIKNAQIYSQLLSKSTPLGFWYSCADGNSNISCVFAREKENGLVQSFFTVFNLHRGPISSFGFDEVGREDFKIILLRFFKSSLHAKVSAGEGKLIFDTLSARGWQNSINVPYEFICWRQLTYDIEPYNAKMSDILTKGLEKTGKAKEMIFEILNSDIFSSWFYKGSEPAEFCNLIMNIEKNADFNINDINKLLNNALQILLSDAKFCAELKEKISFQAYILKNSDMQNSANALYSALLDDNLFKLLLECLLKKSVYFNFLSLLQNETKISESIFSKNKSSDIKKAEIAKNVVKIIENNWM